MARKLDLTKHSQRSAGGQVDYPISTRAPDPELPAQAGLLSDRLQEIARRYLGARRRSGEALLEAARWLSEARAEAQHGEWHIFLEATGTSDDTAERLLNIHHQAMQNPQFADSVSRNWLSQSAAALLARPSTPPEVVAEVLAGDAPPSVTEVKRKIRAARTPGGQILQPADFGGSTPPPWLTRLCQELARAGATCTRHRDKIGTLDAAAAVTLQDAVEQILIILDQVTRVLDQRVP